MQSSASRDGRRHSIESIRRIEAHKEAQAVYSAANGKLPMASCLRSLNCQKNTISCSTKREKLVKK